MKPNKNDFDQCLILEQIIKIMIEEQVHETLNMPTRTQVAHELKKSNRNDPGLIDKIFASPGAKYVHPVLCGNVNNQDFEVSE